MATKKRKKARTPYKTYKAWYEQYSKNNEMDSPMLTYKQFRNGYGLYTQQGVANPARSLARDQMRFTSAQTRNYKRVIKRFSNGEMDLKGKNLRQALIQSILNSKDKNGNRKYFDPGFYMSLPPEDKVDYMRDLLRAVKAEASRVLSANLKQNKQVQHNIGDIITMLHDVYHLSYQEIFSPKEK